MTYWGFFPKGSGKALKIPLKKVVRILTEVYADAMHEKNNSVEGVNMDECSWLSYLIEKSLEKNEIWRELWK